VTDRRPAVAQPLRRCRAYLSAPTKEGASELLTSAVTELVFVAAAEHGKDPLARSPLQVLPGPGPMFAEASGHYLILLSASALEGDYRQQALYQAAHEAVHVVCSPLSGYCWADEMFAAWFAWRVMDALAPDYAHAQLANFSRDCARMTAIELASLDLADFAGESYPPGTYGRAVMTGLHLEAAIGWSKRRALAGPGRPAGPMNVAGWLSSLETSVAAEARELLGLPA